MTDEEKKAIKKVKYICDKWYDESLEIDVKWLESLLSLCEKQSKEIEELREEKAKRQWVHIKENGEVEPLFYVSEDKIKAKIEEINKDFKEYENGQEWEIQDEIRGQIEVLQSLLEKEGE